MVWKRDHSREEVEELLSAIEEQATEAVALAERAQRDIEADRFASFLNFRKKMEEVRALVALTEERVKGLTDVKLADLRVEFIRVDLLLTGLLARATRSYFASMRDDQVLPMGAREMFEPELRNIDETRAKLDRPQYAGQVPPSVIEDLETTSALIRKTIGRAPALPDFSDAPRMPKPMKRLPKLGRPIRM